MADKRTDDVAPRGQAETIELFQVVTVEGIERRWRATRGHMTIGSHEANDVVLDEPTVSRFHCELQTAGDGVWVKDLDSRNGVIVDGIRVREAMLRPGNVLRLGHAGLRFERLAEREPLELSSRGAFGPLVGSSLAMRALFATLERAASTEATLLLEGETGTGKGALAEAVHAASPRRDGPFIVVDCGALAPTLLESELFGHERGAFTGANQRRIGAFEEAAGGTIFLDEIGELPADMQPRLLRVLENRTVRRVGQNLHQPVDVRVIGATNRDLRGLVNERRFRADLYYRLAVVRLHVPALRERIDDLPELAAALLRGLGATPEQVGLLTRAEVLARLQGGLWPGNVRQLRNYLERSLVLEGSPPLDDPTPDAARRVPIAEARRRALAAFERKYLEDLLKAHGGHVSAAARTAGVARVHVYRLLARHGLKPSGDPADD